ncbi:MAG: hypothetical protein NVS2B14_01180 [Chamaesiphon sp.]
MKKTNRFGPLSAALKGEVLPEQIEATQEEQVPELETPSLSTPFVETPPPVKRGRAKGKRSNPDYEQVGAYIPKTLNLEVRRLLLDKDLDFSDLVAQLLNQWVSENKPNN